MKFNLLITFFAVPLTFSNSKASPLPALDNDDAVVTEFLIAAVNEHYGNWISEMNLDPTPVDTQYPVNVGYSNSSDNVYGIFTNHTAWGLSTPKAVTGWTVRLNESTLQFQYLTNAFRFGGKYFVNGTIRSNVTLEGAGNWSMEIGGMGFWMHYFSYQNFVISEDGYINLTNADAFSKLDYVIVDEFAVHIDGLNAGGYEPEVQKTLMENFFSHDKEAFCTRRNPYVRYLDEFLTRAFLSTPISEMGTALKKDGVRFDVNSEFSRNQKEVKCLERSRPSMMDLAGWKSVNMNC